MKSTLNYVLRDGRVRRSSEFSSSGASFRPTNKTHRHSFIIQRDSQEPITVRYRRSRWWDMSEGDRWIRVRSIYTALYLKAEPVGMLEFHEYEVASFVLDEDFFQILDDYSSIGAEMAKALISCWSDIADDLGAYGTILDFRRAWMRPDQTKFSIWAEAAKLIITKEFLKHSVMIMKAFPLEYEGRSTEGSRAMRKRRQRAMIRHYRKLFDVNPLPGQAGREGWLFRIPNRLQGLMIQPEVQKEREFTL